MTFPSTLKKSGPITISKTGTGSGSSSSQGLSRSPVSPLNTSVKVVASESSVKSSTSNKNHGKTSAITTGKKVPISLINPASKSVTKPFIDVKSESLKIATSAAKVVVAKSATKPLPLKLNLKVIDASGVQKSPGTPKSVPKTPTTPSLTKSQTSVVDTKSSSVQSTSKSSSSPVTKSPKGSVLSKASAVSLPAVKTLTSIVPKTSVMSTTVPKLPLSTKLSSPTVKSFASKTVVKENSVPLVQPKAIIVKPAAPTIKKATVLSTKHVTGDKLLTTTNKSSTTPESPSMVSNIKSVSPKVPNSPSKFLGKELKTVKISNSLANKPNAISKSGPSITKVIVNKELSKSSLSFPKTSLMKCTSSVVSKPTTLKTKLISSAVTKNLVPKSPIKKTSLSTLAVAPSLPTVKTHLPNVKIFSPTMKTPISPTVKTKTPSSPTVKPRTTSISAKPPMSPARQKLLPTKLILSPTKSNCLSFSTESLALRTPLKSPMSPKPVPKSPLKVIKKSTKAPVTKTIRGGQPVKKSVINSKTYELPTSKVCNQLETSDVCNLENVVKIDSKEVIESTVPGILNQNQLFFETYETVKSEVNIDDCSKITDTFVYGDVSLNAEIIDESVDVQEYSVKSIEEKITVEFSSLTTFEEQKQDENICSQLGFEIVTKDDCVPQFNSISQSSNNCDVLFVDNHFNTSSEIVVEEHLNEMQSCTVKMEESFELMNDKLVLGDVRFETDSNQSDISDSEQATFKEAIEIVPSDDKVQEHCVDDIFLFTNTEDLSLNDLDRADSIDNFMHQFMPKSVEGASSISTDEESYCNRKSYSEAVVGLPKEGEFDFDYSFNLADDCLDYDDESSVFVEVTEKEFPELKPKDLSCKRRNKKHKKRNCSNRTESLSDSNSSSEEINYNPNDFDGNEFSHYIKMMKDCSFYPSGLFSSDSVKLSTSSSLSWLDISVRTTDDDLIPSTESLSTYEIFQGSNLNKDFLMSVIGCTNAMTPNESSWSWKSIESRHQSHIKTNITLSLQPRPKHLTTPRFMLLLALISEAKGYEIQPSLSEHFVTTDCMPRFDNKIRRLMVQGFWMVGRLITESLSECEETNCGNPFGFADGDLGYWWAGINMLDWQEYLKECGKTQELSNCYQFVIENNIDGKRHNSSEALLSMNASTPEEFMSESDVENFIHSVRNVKYYCGNCFVESEENLEEAMNVDSCNDDNDLVEWGNGSIIQQN